MKKTTDWRFTLWATTAAFCAYACMFAFRKGITAATFEGMAFAGISYKIWLMTVQVMGYALSKLIGIRVVSEIKPSQRAVYIFTCVAIAELSLLGFALVPAPYNIPFLFLNGLPLGFLYGTVLSFLEGRRQTDVLVSGLTASFIFSSGLVKTIGKYLLAAGVSEFWMPFLVGIIFAIPLLIATYSLVKLPPPTAEDQAERTTRATMNTQDRKRFVKTFLWGLVPIIASYVLLTAFRDFRDNFAPEILSAAGVSNPLIFTQTETFISVFILILMALLRWITNNWQAFRVINYLLLAGGLLVGGSTWLFQQGLLPAGVWFTLTGVGLYLGYVPCNGLYFERLVASFRYVSTVSFMVTLADWYGYIGSISVQLYKNFGQPNISFLDFFINGAYILSVFYVLLVGWSFGYFKRKIVTL
jgi:Family of unknown function (DUF5690)